MDDFCFFPTYPGWAAGLAMKGPLIPFLPSRTGPGRPQSSPSWCSSGLMLSPCHYSRLTSPVGNFLSLSRTFQVQSGHGHSAVAPTYARFPFRQDRRLAHHPSSTRRAFYKQHAQVA
jgi:hypothetical protein